MLKSMRNEPKPQPPAAVSAWMIESDCVLFGSVETSVCHGLSPSKSRPDGAVVDVAAVVVVVVLLELVVGTVVGACVLEDVEVDEVVGRLVDVDVEVELDEDVDGRDVDVDVDVVVERVVDVELLDDDELLVDDDEVVAVDVDVDVAIDVDVDEEVDDDVVLGARVVDVVVVEVEVVVVVVFFFRAVSSKPQTQPVHASPAGQSAAVSHVSPAPTSRRPSPQLDADAVNARRAVRRTTTVPSIVAQESAIFAFTRTFRSAPHAAQRARTTVASPRFAKRARTGPQWPEMVAAPAASTTIASKAAPVPCRRGPSVRKRTSGQGGAVAPLAIPPNASTSPSATARRMASVDRATRARTCDDGIAIRASRGGGLPRPSRADVEVLAWRRIGRRKAARRGPPSRRRQRLAPRGQRQEAAVPRRDLRMVVERQPRGLGVHEPGSEREVGERECLARHPRPAA